MGNGYATDGRRWNPGGSHCRISVDESATDCRELSVRMGRRFFGLGGGQGTVGHFGNADRKLSALVVAQCTRRGGHG